MPSLSDNNLEIKMSPDTVSVIFNMAMNASFNMELFRSLKLEEFYMKRLFVLKNKQVGRIPYHPYPQILKSKATMNSFPYPNNAFVDNLFSPRTNECVQNSTEIVCQYTPLVKQFVNNANHSHVINKSAIVSLSNWEGRWTLTLRNMTLTMSFI